MNEPGPNPVQVFLSESGIVIHVPQPVAEELAVEMLDGEPLPGEVWHQVSDWIRQKTRDELRVANDAAPEYSEEEMRAVVQALATMIYAPSDEDKAKARGLLDQARAKGLL